MKIKLSNSDKYAIISKSDYEVIAPYDWIITSNGYAIVNGKFDVPIYMHRLIMNTPDDLVCDHINRNRLDNRRSNLRNVTFSDNLANRKPKVGRKYKGVHYNENRLNYEADIRYNYKTYHLGRYNSEEEGAYAYNIAVVILRGRNCLINKGVELSREAKVDICRKVIKVLERNGVDVRFKRSVKRT